MLEATHVMLRCAGPCSMHVMIPVGDLGKLEIVEKKLLEQGWTTGRGAYPTEPAGIIWMAFCPECAAALVERRPALSTPTEGGN